MAYRSEPFMWSPAHQAVAAAVAVAAGVPSPSLPTGQVDWDHFLDLVDLHLVGPLVHRSGLLPQLRAPEQVVASLAEDARRLALQTLGQLRFTDQLVSALRRSGIQAVVIKGLPLAYLGYGDILSRHAGDVDLLVSPDQVVDAVEMLDHLGLALRSWSNGPPVDRVRAALANAGKLPALHEVRFVGDGITVDLHWRLFEDDRLCPLLDPADLRHPEYVRLGGTVLPVLPLPLLWHLVAVQGTMHSWRRLKWIADVPALVGRHPELVAPGQPIDPSGITALRVAERVLGPFLPAGADPAQSGFGSGSAGRTTRPAGTSRAARHTAALGVALLERRALRQLADDGRLGARAVGGHRWSHDPAGQPATTWERWERQELGPPAGRMLARLALRSESGYRWAEVRRLLLHAGRQRLVADPGPFTLAAGPFRFLGRRVGEAGRRGVHRTAQAWLQAETLAELTRTCVELRILPQRRVVRLLGGMTPLPGAVSADQARAAAAVGRVVSRMARRLPWHPTCVQQAFAAARMLRRRRIPGRLYLGVPDPATRAAQAWLTGGDEVVLEVRGADRLTAVVAAARSARRGRAAKLGGS